MKKNLSFLLCICIVAQMLMTAGMAISVDMFGDISNHWAKSYIEILCDRDIINGYSDGTFAPDNALAKGEAAKLICLSANVSPSDTAPTQIEDIDEHWAKQYITVLPVTPTKNNRFYPNQNITRAEFSQMVVGALYLPLPSNTDTIKTRFKDWATIPEQAIPYVALAVEKGIINGYEDSTFRPNATLTRAEACTMLKRAFFPDVKPKASKYYIDTLAFVGKVEELIADGNDSVYYIEDNVVYHATPSGKNVVWDANTTSYTIPTTDIQEASNLTLADWSLSHLKDFSEITFSNFAARTLLRDSKTDELYALGYGIGETSYITSIEVVVLVNLNIPQEIATKAYCYTGYFGDGLPGDWCAVKNGENVYYESNGRVYCLNTRSNRITLYTEERILGAVNATFWNDELWYLDTMWGFTGPSSHMIKHNLSGASNIKVDLFNNANEEVVHVCTYKDNFYYWSTDSHLYRISPSDKQPQKLISYNDDGYSPKITVKDSLPFKDLSQFYLWAADENGALYFYDATNQVIRKLYGV